MGDILYKNLLKKWALLFSIIYFIKAPQTSAGSAHVTFYCSQLSNLWKINAPVQHNSFFRLTDEVNSAFTGLPLLRGEGSTAVFLVSQRIIQAQICGWSSSLVWWVSSGPHLPPPTAVGLRSIMPNFSLLLPSFAASTKPHLSRLGCSSSHTKSYQVNSPPSLFQPLCCNYWFHKSSCSFSLSLSLSAFGG